jgi:hypothetical protein
VTEANALPSEDELDAIVANQRRGRLIVLVLVAVVVIGGATAIGIYLSTRPEPRCSDPDEVDFFVSDKSLPAEVVGRVCTFPSSLAKALRGMEVAPPEYRALLLLRAVSDSPSLILDVCPGGIRSLANAGRIVLSEQTAVFLEGCDLSETELDQGAASRAPLARAVMGVAVYGALRETDPDDAGRIANRVLAGP